MRKALILTTVLAGIGGLAAVAQASQDRGPDKDNSQITPRTESARKDREHLGGPHDARSNEGRGQHRDERREAHEKEEHEDRE
jgi:hypothetical protein